MNIETPFKLLGRIYFDGEFSGDVLRGDTDPFDTRLVYGVLERDVELEYILGKLIKSAKPKIRLILKIALYAIKYLGSVPDYAACDCAVEFAKSIGKKESAGFINAVLRNYVRNGVKMPEDETEALAVSASVPLWIVKRLIADYGFEKVSEFLKTDYVPFEHFRRNAVKISEAELERELGSCKRSETGGYILTRTPAVDELIKSGKLLYQAQGSMLIAQTVAEVKPKSVLDVCAAPGGKAVYLSESAEVTACDVSERRVGLIRKYAAHAGVKLKTVVNDGTIYNPGLGVYDAVLADVPCSCLGLRFTRPDVLLNRKEQEISSLAGVQAKILDVSANYVKEGGVLVYSTCTVLKEENEEVVRGFLKKHPEFRPYESDLLGGTEKQILPCKENPEGFFVARLRRI